jgi:uncharacterized protein (DUF1810 family)
MPPIPSEMNDFSALQRFVDAQEGVFAQALEELRGGRKRSHWMWFVFPQIAGLGRSETARRYAIASLAEAQAYLRHPILGPRLVECVRLAGLVDGRSAREIFGAPDDMKFWSSLTLFAQAAAADAPFKRALDEHFGGRPDPATLERLRG